MPLRRPEIDASFYRLHTAIHHMFVRCPDITPRRLCWLMDSLRARFAKRPSEAVLDRAIAEAFASLRELGVFNALLGDGRSLYTSCSKHLCFIRRAAPFGRARLIDEDLEVDFAKETSPDDKVVIVATRPLTRDEVWTDIAPGTTLIFREGDLARRFDPVRTAA